MVSELVRSDYSVTDLFCTEFFDEIEGLETTLISEKELARISVFKNPNRVLAVAEIPEQKRVDLDQSLILFLDGIRDPGNLGTIIRTARWFGVSHIICSEDCAEVYNPKTVQSTMGALFHVNVYYKDLETTLTQYKHAGFCIMGAAMNGESLHGLRASGKTALVIGSESHGISENVLNLCDLKATIPNMEKEQKVESLNAAVANALFLSELTKNLTQ